MLGLAFQLLHLSAHRSLSFLVPHHGAYLKVPKFSLEIRFASRKISFHVSALSSSR